jgi:hypothetical protein
MPTMTAFISRCSTSLAERLRRWCVLVLLAVVAMASAAEEGAIVSAEIVAGDGGYVLNADIDIELNPRLIDAVSRGVSLYFTTELSIERPRWYWFNRVVVERSLDYRLYYHAITRSYRLSIGSFHQSFDNLDSAIMTMQRVRNWLVAEPGALEAGVSHNVSLRFRLDTSQLPKPFQVTAIGSRDWSLATDWLNWTFIPGAAGAR